MNINFDTDNLIIVFYPGLAGGKFLINCLGLSDDVVFQDHQLAQKQLDLKFIQQDKINYLLDKLAETVEWNDYPEVYGWNDLDLGCMELFGISNSDYVQLSSDEIRNLQFNDVITTLSNSSKKFFIVAHWPNNVARYLTVWPNAKLITFKNYSKFINFRIHDRIKENVYIPMSDEMPNNYNEVITKFSDQMQLWDTDWYFDEKDTIAGIKNLYQSLNLSNFNEKAITSYYTAWINKLKELKTK